LEIKGANSLAALVCWGNQLTAEALNDLFGSLSKGERYVWISNNPGTETYNKRIASNFGWIVNSLDTFDNYWGEW
jgi:hypothetical protein